MTVVIHLDECEPAGKGWLRYTYRSASEVPGQLCSQTQYMAEELFPDEPVWIEVRPDEPPAVPTMPSVVLTGRVDRTPEYDATKAEHCWATIATFRVIDPTSGTTIADAETLTSLSEPGCVFCEQQYTPDLATRRCYGPTKWWDYSS